MPLLVNDPCDNFTAAPWTAAGTAAVTASGYVGNGFTLSVSAANYVQYSLAAPAEADVMTIGCRIKWSTLPATFTTFASFRSDAAGTSHVELRCTSPAAGGTISAWRGTVGSLVATPSATIATGVWYNLEVTTKLHDAAGNVTIVLDGVVVATTPTTDTKNGGTKTTFDSFRFMGASNSNFIIDDIYIRNDAGVMSLPGGDARLAQTSERALVRNLSPDARLAQVDLRAVTRLGITDAMVAQMSVRSLVALIASGGTVKVWDGSAFESAPVKVWDGSAFVDSASVKTWNGSVFV